MLSNTDAGGSIHQLREAIRTIRSEMDELGEPMSDMPELIESANLIRSNEYLNKMNRQQARLIAAYAGYARALEDMLGSVFAIQNDLKDILKEQSVMLSAARRDEHGKG